MRSSLASGKSATPPARCIHRPQRDTSSAGYHLLVSRASAGASRELSSRRSPALVPHTCAVSPTFRYGAFPFVAFALAAISSARLRGSHASADWESTALAPANAARPTASVDMASRRRNLRRQMTPRHFRRVVKPRPSACEARRGCARPLPRPHA